MILPLVDGAENSDYVNASYLHVRKTVIMKWFSSWASSELIYLLNDRYDCGPNFLKSSEAEKKSFGGKDYLRPRFELSREDYW